MKLGIMQPYFFPYIGYFQLIAAVDQFVIYDNIKYTKKGWINRNRFLQNGVDTKFSIFLKGGSDSLNICERILASEFDRVRLLNQLRGAYHSAPYFDKTFPLIEQVVLYPELNLFLFLRNSILQICAHLGITTKIITSSNIGIDHRLQGQNKVLAMCGALGATTYLNPIGGMELYSKEVFSEKGVDLGFIKPLPITYAQYNEPFIPWLSIIDVLMFNPLPWVYQRINYGHTII